MTDPNALRSHYRRTSAALHRRKKRHEALKWLALWLTIAAVCVVSALA